MRNKPNQLIHEKQDEMNKFTFLGILDCKKLVIVMIWIRQATPALAIDTATFLRQHHL